MNKTKLDYLAHYFSLFRSAKYENWFTYKYKYRLCT